MVEIIPAVMPQTFGELRERTEEVVGLVRTIQIDVMDGVFVPEKSWPYSEDPAMLERLERDGEGLPSWEDINVEVDLMVQEPEDIFADWIGVCVSRMIVHIESMEEPRRVVPLLRGYLEAHQGSGDCLDTIELGLAIDVQTPLESLYELLPYADFVQCMGIAKIGYQGQPFDERVIPKIEAIRALHDDVIISVDGAVNHDTARSLVDAGATRLVSGSAIFSAPDIGDSIDRLRTISNNT